MKTQTYMTIRMCSFVLAAAIPTLGVVAAAQQIENRRAASAAQPTRPSPCATLAYITSNRNGSASADILDVAPSSKPGCR